MTFKDLKKRLILETTPQQQSKLFEICKDKPFWIWNVNEHRREDISKKGNCCFNHIIGLPIKNGVEKPMFDYQKLLYDFINSSN